MRRLLTCLTLLVALAGLPAASALADSGSKTATTHGHAAKHPKKAGKKPGAGAGKVSATQGNAVINDCQAHGELTKPWTKAELRKALAVMSAEAKQYSNCQSAIQAALAGKVTSGGSGGGGGGSSTGTIVIIVVVVVVLLAAIIGGLALRRRRSTGATIDADTGSASGPEADDGSSEDPTRVRPPGGGR